MDKQLIKGLFIGFVAPIVAYVIYVAFYLEADVIETYKSLVKINKLSHVISLSVLINLLIFFMLGHDTIITFLFYMYLF